MQRIFAIVSLTWKAAFRYRLFWVLALLLVAAVAGLPLVLKDDGTAEGLTQIVLTYTLTAVTTLLGICTLWLACGVLARDIEECQIQMLAVKPIARWQIWLGKWLGLLSLNAALLAVAGLSIYGSLEYRARKLPPEMRARLDKEVLVARASVHEPDPIADIEKATDRDLAEELKQKPMDEGARKARRDQILAEYYFDYQVIEPRTLSQARVIHLAGLQEKLKGQPLTLRVKFNSADAIGSGTGKIYACQWRVGTPAKVWDSPVMNLPAGSFQEFEISPDLYDEKTGDLFFFIANPNNETLLLSFKDGMELLYHEASFEVNFARALGVIFCWLALLSALGMAAASVVSFPVAAFASLAALGMVFSANTLSDVVSTGTLGNFDEETGIVNPSRLDPVVVPVFRVILGVINMARDYSPIDALTTGHSIGWGQLAKAFAQIVLILGGILVAGGIFFFSRRELATAQGTT